MMRRLGSKLGEIALIGSTLLVHAAAAHAQPGDDDLDNPYASGSVEGAPEAPKDEKPTSKPEADADHVPGGDSADASAEESASAPPPKAEKAPPTYQTKPDTRAEAMAAYHKALADRRLAATTPLSRQRLADEVASAELELADGRRDEAIGDLVTIVESERFGPFAKTEEARAMVFLLGDAFGRAGAYEPARGYLVRLLEGDPTDVWYRRAVRSLVDLGLDSGRPEMFLEDLAKVPKSASEEARGDIAYLRGRAAEKADEPAVALAAYAEVTPRSRFWAQATYLSGLVEVERGRLKAGENLFCKVADAKLTPKMAPLFGGSDFFRIRDLSRLALGRVAHEQYRHDDARYYYYLVPSDSEHLPEALYESSTTRYEKKDYGGARDLMDQLKSLERNHPYEDEAWILDAYIDLAVCDFPTADAKLARFIEEYEPVRDAARRLTRDEAAMRKLVEAVRRGADPAGAGTGVRASVARALGALLRVEAEYATKSREVAQVEHQLSGLRRTMQELDDARRRIADPKNVRAQAEGPLGATQEEKMARVEAQLAEVRRLVREAERAAKAGQKGADAKVADLKKQLEGLELRTRAARASMAVGGARTEQEAKTLPDVIAADRRRATELHGQAEKVRQTLLAEQVALAKDALVRLDRRLSRLLARARLGKIETVLGKKRALEVEVEALSQGYLPQGAVDSLDAARYLRDDEEYWPFDGEDWADEYVGGEGLR